MIWAIRQELAAKRDGRDGLLAIKAEVVEDNMDVMVNGVVVELGDSEANGKFRLLIWIFWFSDSINEYWFCMTVPIH